VKLLFVPSQTVFVSYGYDVNSRYSIFRLVLAVVVTRASEENFPGREGRATKKKKSEK